MLHQVPRTTLPHKFGEISRISLGSWNTFSRCSKAELRALLGEALDNGINLFDVGYYWDKPDTEAAFAGAMNGLAPSRDSYLIAQKLWLWDYPEQSFRTQLEASLSRLQHEHVDMVLVSRPTAAIELETMIGEVVELVRAGLSRGWGITNFESGQIRKTLALCTNRGWPKPLMQQMQYNVTRRAIVEEPSYSDLFASGEIALCAANVLEGGILAGHLDRDRVDPPDFEAGKRPPARNIARDSGSIREEIRRRQPQLAELAARIGGSAAQLSIALVLSHPGLATALLGVTKPKQLKENISALALVPRLEEIREELDAIAIAKVGHPKLFNPRNDI